MKIPSVDGEENGEEEVERSANEDENTSEEEDEESSLSSGESSSELSSKLCDLSWSSARVSKVLIALALRINQVKFKRFCL